MNAEPSTDRARDFLLLLEELVDVRANCLGAERHPVRLATGAVGSALVVLFVMPLSSPLASATVGLFLGLAVYLLLVADRALTTRGGEFITWYRVTRSGEA